VIQPRIRTISIGVSVEAIFTNRGELTMNNTTAVKDLVCGMDIDSGTAAGRTEFEGQTYYFCGLKCKEKFDLNPQQYLGKPAGGSKSGCCCG
jgi:Cu+-exporting ATPase